MVWERWKFGSKSGYAMAAITGARAMVDRSVIFAGARGEQMNMNRSIDTYERWRFDFPTALRAFISSRDDRPWLNCVVDFT
jgi:hypothetical protein